MRKFSADIEHVYALLKEEFHRHRMPVVELIEMQTKDPFKVLVATILSARTKDQTTAAAVGRLFDHIATSQEMAALPLEEIEKLIYPVGFYHEKARHLSALHEALLTHFDGRIPDTVEELVKLPGVGRKTANLVVAVGFNKPAVCVDIHVHRICNRLGYLVSKTPLETEMLLRKYLPIRLWTTFNSYFVSYGQHHCTPVAPHCSTCQIRHFCARKNITTSR